MLLFTETRELRALAVPEPRLETPEGFAQTPLAIAKRRREARVAGAVEPSRIQHFIRLEEPAIDERLQAQEQRTAREGRRAVVRRRARAEWADRQHLPIALTCTGQKIHEKASLRSQIPDAVWTGQGSRVKEDPAATIGKWI